MWPASASSCKSLKFSNLAHKEVKARVNLEVLEALHLPFNAHQQSAEADVDRSVTIKQKRSVQTWLKETR